jgi:hypothetical protein
VHHALEHYSASTKRSAYYKQSAQELLLYWQLCWGVWCWGVSAVALQAKKRQVTG